GEMLRRIEAVRRAVAPFSRPRVLYVLWPDPLIVPGRASMLTELIDVAGGASITAGDGDAYPRFSLEAAVARAPEVIILADHSTGSSTAGRSSPEKWRQLASVPAIRAGRRLTLALAVLAVVLLVVAGLALFVGSAGLSPRAVARALAGRAGAESVESVVTLQLRLPRVVAAVLAGGALAVAGVAFQGLTRNPLAEPAVLGLSSGAAVGVVLAQIFSLGLSARQALGDAVFAFAGA